MKEIKFYKSSSPYYCFCNFSYHSFTEDGVLYKTSEHYYQSKKFLDKESQDKIIQFVRPHEAAKLGRSPDMPLRKDWEEVKVSVMKQALKLKFEAHPDIMETLLSTEDAIIIEASPVDYFWGCGATGEGKSMLGKLLMELREEKRMEAGV